MLRLTSTAIAKAFLPRLSVLCMRETSSNRRRNRARHIAFEERDEAKLHRLSPQRHPQGRGQGGRVQGGETRPAARRSRRPLRGRRDGEQRSAMAAAARAGPSRTRGRAGPWRRARAAARNPLLPPPPQPRTRGRPSFAAARFRLLRGGRRQPLPPHWRPSLRLRAAGSRPRTAGAASEGGREGGRAGADPGGRQDRRGERGRKGD